MEGFSHIYAAHVIEGEPENFTGVEVNGVRYSGEETNGRWDVVIDNKKPEFVSAYVRHKDGGIFAVGDFGTHGECVTYARQLAERYSKHGWTFADKLAEAH